jgi:hypothetical protein
VSSQIVSQLSTLVDIIKKLQPLLDEESQRLRGDIEINDSNKFDANLWCQIAMGDSLIKLRLFTEQNFNHIETMSLLAVTRYIFEMSVWLKLFKINPQYGLVYYSQLTDNKIRYLKSCRTQAQREIALLKKFDSKGESLWNAKLEKILSNGKQNTDCSSYSNITKLIDDEASRHFSIYAEQAKNNGYSYQAHLIETQALVNIEKSILELEKEKLKFSSSVSNEIINLIPKHWNWCEMAKMVNLNNEYDFIYSYTSMLLHATPSSITTDQKNLEFGEINIFLKYIHVKIRDILNLASIA